RRTRGSALVVAGWKLRAAARSARWCRRCRRPVARHRIACQRPYSVLGAEYLLGRRYDAVRREAEVIEHICAGRRLAATVDANHTAADPPLFAPEVPHPSLYRDAFYPR